MNQRTLGKLLLAVSAVIQEGTRTRGQPPMTIGRLLITFKLGSSIRCYCVGLQIMLSGGAHAEQSGITPYTLMENQQYEISERGRFLLRCLKLVPQDVPPLALDGAVPIDMH